MQLQPFLENQALVRPESFETLVLLRRAPLLEAQHLYQGTGRISPRPLTTLGNCCRPWAPHPSIRMPASVGLENGMFVLVPLALRSY